MLLKARNILSFLLLLVLLYSCTSTKNTATTRWYHSFNTRYNVYFNGNEAYKEAMKNMQDTHQETYSEMIYMFPVSALPKDKSTTGGSFDKSIEKSVKAIKRHSIQTKPEKNPKKSRDPKYQEFMSRTEYNPFLHNAWMMMAKSQFHNGDFLQAASSFSYISRLYSSQPEISLNAKIWQARSYAEIEWYYEAENILTNLNNDKLPSKLTNWFSTVYADLLLKQKRYRESVPYLQIAIKAEKNKHQRAREKYLLGQVYMALDEKALAYKAFGEVSSANAPYILEFSAKIRQTEVYPGGDTTKVIKQLNKMAKSSKNKDYLDQVYYAMGNVYMSIPDTAKAIVSYEKGVEESTQNGIDKTLNQIKLGDIYFQQRKYLDAQPNYSEALGQLKKGDEAYPRVSKRSEVLDELVIYFEAVQLQDSLQRLSRMSEEERLVVVNKIIEDLIKKEKEEQEKAEREEYLAQREERRSEQQTRPVTNAVTAPTTGGDSFYFYNDQAVAQGKNSFQQKWGRRKLEDDWRRKNKTSPMVSQWDEDVQNLEESAIAEGEEALAEGSTESRDFMPELSSDPKDPQYYLQQIPVTEEELAASDLIIMDGLFNMGMIYKDKLENYALAIETFETLNSRFPDNEHKLEAYYQTYLMYWKDGNMQIANLYKLRIRNEFSESDYAVAMADPDYEYNLKMTQIVQDSLYKSTYEAYLNSNIREVRNNFELASTKYNQSKLMPKFMFLNALSYVQTNDAEAFKEALKELIEKYPDEDVSVLAAEMMKGFQRGLLLSNSGDNMLARGGLFNIRFGAAGDSLAVDSTLTFIAEKNTPHKLLLVYPLSAINENLFLFTVAGFNFGNFMVNDFGLEKTAISNEVGMLQITGFNNLPEVMQYIQMINQPGAYGQELGEELIMVPISVENYDILMKGMSLDEYMDFFAEHFYEGNENLVTTWDLKQEKELEVLENEESDELIPEAGKPEEALPDSIPIQQEFVPDETSSPEEEEQDEIEISETLPEEIVSDSIPVTLPVQTEIEEEFNFMEADSLHTETETDVTPDELLDGVGNTINEGVDKLEQINDAINKIADDPVRGIQNLFKRKKSNAIDEYVKQQEKEEKELKKQQEAEQKEKEKAARELAKQQEKEKQKLLKKQQEEERAVLKAKEEEEKALAKLKEQERKQAEKEKARLAKEKEDARKAAQKQKEQERKEKEEQRKLEQKQKEQARKEAQKLKEQERKEREKARKDEQKRKDEERKQKEQARKEDQKRKEAERKANQKNKK